MNQVKHILVIDDEEAIRYLLERIIAHFCANCQLTALGKSDAIKSHIQEQFFDLAFIDYHIPGLNGLELAYIIRQISPQTKIVLMSGNDSDSVVFAKAIEDQLVNQFLPKPFLPDHINQIVNQLAA